MAKAKKKKKDRRKLDLILWGAAMLICGIGAFKAGEPAFAQLIKMTAKPTVEFEKVEVPEMVTEELEIITNDTAEPSEAEIPGSDYYSVEEAPVVAAIAENENIISSHMIVINETDGQIIAAKDAYERINPASMTKILTLLVAAEELDMNRIDDHYTIGYASCDYAYVNDCSIAGFSPNEDVTIRDLFYGVILPSGAEAVYELANYIAGSQDAFVELMNAKLEELGLSETTHFTNAVGLYNEDHYSTCYDIAMILHAAMENEFCREVLGTRVYTTTKNETNPDGLVLSNWFLRRIEDKDTKGDVIGAKTGFVNQSGNCAASYEHTEDGRDYICVSTGSTSSWNCIYDHVEAYNAYIE